MLVQWLDSYAVGVPEVDAQHQEIFRRVDRLLSAMQEGKGRQEVGAMVDYLGEYVVAHFNAEEKVMARHGYPEMAAHKALHAAFMADFAALKREFEAKGTSTLLAIQIQRRVVDWLVTHIGREDRRIAAYIKGQ